jgi:hypothetical protein
MEDNILRDLEGSDCSLIETETRNLLSAFKENP